MIGVVLALGKCWQSLATVAAKMMQASTGLSCQVITSLPIDSLVAPYWGKLWLQGLFPGEDLLIFDADLMPQQSWQPADLLEDSDFGWVVDPSPNVAVECQQWGLDPAQYGNSGLILVRAVCPVLKDAQSYYPNCGRWPEQTAINRTTQNRDYKVRILPETYNKIVRKHQHQKALTGRYSECNLHFVGLSNMPDRLRRLHQLQEHFRCIWKV